MQGLSRKVQPNHFHWRLDYGWENNFFVEALSACFEIKLRELLREDRWDI